MNLVALLETATDAGSGGGNLITTLLIYVVGFGAVIYFLMIRPNKKEQKRMGALISSVAVGDTVLTSSGFIGEVVDIGDDYIFMEFGNNKNCRIPVKKTAIAEVEKADNGSGAQAVEEANK